MEEKICLKCGNSKPLSEFIGFKGGGTTAYCQSCVRLLMNDDFAVNRYDKLIRRKPKPWR